MTALAGFRDVHAGATIVVCGCGPSLMELVDARERITIGVNDVGRLFDPTYLVVVNPRGQFSADRFRHIEHSGARALFTQLDLGHVAPPVVRFKLGAYGGTSPTDGATLHYTQNSPYVAVCLAAHMGARRIELIGVDLTDHHFFGATGRHALSGRLREIDAQYGKLATALRQRGIELVNLSTTSRLTSLPKSDRHTSSKLHIVSYATTPVAGVPGILARCIEKETAHTSRCVWATRGYGNGLVFDAALQWTERATECVREIEAADVVVVHNGKVDPRHTRLLAGKHVVTLAHNYMWNVDAQFVQQGMPGMVVGQYQATLPEFAGWTVVPNPIPLHEAAYGASPKPDVVTICYTPSGRHERYQAGHRLYWHGKGYATTMHVLDRIAAELPVRLEVVRNGQVSHAESLAMKRRAHIVIDECVTGSYHRNSLEGLATGCVVVNGVGLLPGVADALRACAPDAGRVPFVFSTLDTLDGVLRDLIACGASALEEQGQQNRQWMQAHWNFARQWERIWAPAVARRSSKKLSSPMREDMMQAAGTNTVSVIVPHGGAERLPLLAATLASLRQATGVGEVIVVEMGEEPLAESAAGRWADKHLFIEHSGEFERARALNAGAAIAACDFVLWHDNDLLAAPGFIPRSVKEMCDRKLDYLVPYSSVRYLSRADSLAVMRGERDPANCRPVNTIPASRRTEGCIGCIGLVRRDFLRKHGGFIEGFRGWGGEDNAWNRKVTLLGRSAPTALRDQHVHHLYHEASGGYVMAAAGATNPHYSSNVELLQRVCATRSPAQLAHHFPTVAPAEGRLTTFSRPRGDVGDDALTVWTYWEGPCPAWIRACRRTIDRYAPRVRLLTPQTFDALRDRDRDIDLSRLQVQHRADYVRAFLLHRYGGLWIDADCIVMQPLQPVLELLAEHDFLGHRERVGLVSNAFIGARRASRIARAFYETVSRTIRSRNTFSWNGVGAEPLTSIVAADATGWHELPTEHIQPVCWSTPQNFFAQRTDVEHDAVFDPRALCYMMSNVLMGTYTAGNAHPDLLDERTFFSYLMRRALGTDAPDASSRFEDVFSMHGDIFRQHRSESVSGPGSSLEQTQELRKCLPLLMESLGIETLVDAPCGDLNWMRHVDLRTRSYIGVDVLREIVENNTALYGNATRRFLRADVVNEVLPTADAIFCRDLLVHLPLATVTQALRNFKASGATYLMTTTFTGAHPNADIQLGSWRPLNFTLAPFNFPPPVRIITEGCTEGRNAFRDKSIGVWRLQELSV